jgi:hypothetical protein
MADSKHLQQLGEALQADDRLHAYILIDPLWDDPMDMELVAMEGCSVSTIPTKGPGLVDYGEATYPRLIAWRPQAVDTLRASLHAALREQAPPTHENLKAFAMGGWLLSAENAATVARHLSRSYSVHLKTWTSARWGDRRLLEWMWPVMEPIQQAALLGPVVAWWALNRHGNLVVRTPPEGVERGTLPLLLEEPVQLRQWQRFQHSQQLIRAWCQLTREVDSPYMKRVSELMDDALPFGITNLQDLTLLCAYAAQVHPRIARHPAFVQKVMKAKEAGLSLAEALENIPDPEGWNAMREELNQSQWPLTPSHRDQRQGVH